MLEFADAMKNTFYKNMLRLLKCYYMKSQYKSKTKPTEEICSVGLVF